LIDYFTVYSLGLRLGEGLRLQVGDVDAQRGRVHIRDANGNKDRFVPLPQVTLASRVSGRCIATPSSCFPIARAGSKQPAPLDRGGVQITLHKVVEACGIKKRSRPTVFATPTPRT
jgi:integrase